MAKLINCKVCGQPVAKSAKTCPHCGAKQKKSGFRMFFVSLLLFAGIIIIAFSLATSPTVDKAVSTAAEKVSSDLVTLENFNKINSSMTYEDVCKLFGKDGTLDSEVDLAGIKTQMYHWYDITGIANCNVTFQNGMMTAKSQIGLK